VWQVSNSPVFFLNREREEHEKVLNESVDYVSIKMGLFCGMNGTSAATG
jgi:hypothetical protein